MRSGKRSKSNRQLRRPSNANTTVHAGNLPHRKDTSTIDVLWYVVAFIDLLGYEEKLVALDDVLQSVGLAQPIADEHVRHVVGRVVIDLEFVRKTIVDYFTTYQEQAPRSDWMMRLRRQRPSDWSKYRRWVNCEYRIQTISDSIIISVPLKESNTHFPITGVNGLLEGCAAAMAWCLAGGIPIRGAIALGAGTSYFGTDVVSTALGAAAKLEKRAGHPRIVVSDRVIEYLSAQTQRRGTHEDHYCQSMATSALRIIRDDGDGFRSLDYLCPELRDRFGPDRYDWLVHRAYGFVSEAVGTFESAGNSMLAERYRRVAEYFKSSAPDILSAKQPLESRRIILGQIIASTHIDRTGERLSEAQLQELFEQIDLGMPNTTSHDMSLRPICRGLNKRLEVLPDGELAITMDIEIFDEAAFAEMGGFSIAYTLRTIRFGEDDVASIRVLVNPRQFDLDDVAKLLAPIVPHQLTFDVTERVEKGDTSTAIIVVVANLAATITNELLPTIGEDVWSRLKQLRRHDAPSGAISLQLIVLPRNQSARILLLVDDKVSTGDLAKLNLVSIEASSPMPQDPRLIDRIVGRVLPGPTIAFESVVMQDGTSIDVSSKRDDT